MSHNVYKCGPILIFFTTVFLDDQHKKVVRVLDLTAHFKSVAAVPCEIWMFNFATVGLQHVYLMQIIQLWYKVVHLQFLFFRYAKFCFLCLYVHEFIMLQRVFKLSALSTAHTLHACFEFCCCTSPVNGCVSDALLNSAVQNV